jgi:hypothetical protein
MSTGAERNPGDDAGNMLLNKGTLLAGSDHLEQVAADMREELCLCLCKEARGGDVFCNDRACGRLWSRNDVMNASIRYHVTAQLASGEIVEGEGYATRDIPGKAPSVAEQDGWMLLDDGSAQILYKCYIFLLVQRSHRVGLRRGADIVTRRFAYARPYRLERVSSPFENTLFDDPAALMRANTDAV